MSLPSPLTASDEWVKPRENAVEVVRVTAGLHRQVWVSGTSIYVDVHIANNSRKAIRKIELQLERDILCYKHVGSSIRFQVHLKMLTRLTRRLLRQQWRNLQVRLEFSIATSSLFSANHLLSRALLVGMGSLLTKLISALATLKSLAAMRLSSVVS